MQKHVNLVDLVKSFPTNILLQHLASIQKRTSSVKFAHLDEKSGKGSISNLSTKVRVPLLTAPSAVLSALIAELDANATVLAINDFQNSVVRVDTLHVADWRLVS